MATKTPPQPTRDLFDDTTMTFGEHLDALRIHLFKSIIGLVLAMCLTLVFGDQLIRMINEPVTEALHSVGLEGAAIDDITGFHFTNWIMVQLGYRDPPPAPEPPPEINLNQIEVKVLPSELASALHQSNPKAYPKIEGSESEEAISLTLTSPVFAQWREATERTLKPITLNVQEGFMTYLKVSLVAGFVVASPWIFFQIWQFIAAGLYPQERKYVHFYLPVGLGLFLGGAFFCFYVVLPFVLRFLLGFNQNLGTVSQIRLSEWINFALLLPVMFGLSFQLPLVMLLLERIQVFDVRNYREKRRIAYLVIAVLSMVLTPAEPTSMIAMMIPLIVLYELGIVMCSFRASRNNPFGAPA